MKAQYSLTDPELLRYADMHIRYELEMLLAMSAAIPSLFPRIQEGPIFAATNNAFMNSFALHSRNLIYFLYARSLGKDRPSDIIVQDYIDSPIVDKNLLPLTPLLRETVLKAGKQAAHLTFERIGYESNGGGWHIIDIDNDILTAFHSISQFFPVSRISPSFRDLISQNLEVQAIQVEIVRDETKAPIGLVLLARPSK
jgi:hypothetical protein